MAADIKVVGFDLDGTLTDGGFYYLGNGHWGQRYSVRDGYGIVRLKEAGYVVAFITYSGFESAKERAKMLGIEEAYFEVSDKLQVMKDIAHRHGVALSQCAFMGDDLPDISLLEAVGLSGTVPEAMDAVKRVCDFVATRSAGNGAAREFIEYILSLEKER